MTKEFILSEIRRTAKENGGSSLGRQRFYAATGIKESDWYGKYWTRWSDAIKDAGLTPNTLQQAFEDDYLLDRLALLIREIGHFPTSGELRLKARNDETFPSHNTFRRFGSKAQLISRIVEYCQQNVNFDDVVDIGQSLVSVVADEIIQIEDEEMSELGYVYLIKSGRYYKIGRSNSVGRRVYELATQLPEKADLLHSISTDDPIGIEAYWHKRFADKRKNGEWFELSSSEVKIFRRRKFM